MAKIQTRPWDAAEHLETDEDMAAYLEAALEEGDPALVAAALGDIARAKGMAQIARETGLGRREPLQGVVAGRQPGVCHHPQGGAGAWPTVARDRHAWLLPPVWMLPSEGGIRRFLRHESGEECYKMI